MLNLSNILDATQADWPLIASLALVGISDNAPAWAIESAQRVATQLPPSMIAASRHRVREHAAQLAQLHQRWIVAAVLASLLAMAVVTQALSGPLSSVQLGVLCAVMMAILLPPLAICNGISRDYVAAHALSLVLGGTVEKTSSSK